MNFNSNKAKKLFKNTKALQKETKPTADFSKLFINTRIDENGRSKN